MQEALRGFGSSVLVSSAFLANIPARGGEIVKNQSWWGFCFCQPMRTSPPTTQALQAPGIVQSFQAMQRTKLHDR